MNTEYKLINKQPKLEDHIKTAKLDLLTFSGSGYKIDNLDKLANHFVLVYDEQQSQWSSGREKKAELMNAMREWMCYNLHVGNEKSFTKIVLFLKKLSKDLRQKFLIDICGGFDDFLRNRSVYKYTGVKEMCTIFIYNKTVINDFFCKPHKNWTSFHAYPGNYLLYSTLGGMKKITNTFVDLGFYEMYFDHLLTLNGTVENIVEQTCIENGWYDIVEKLVT